MVEFIGVLSVDPHLAHFEGEEEGGQTVSVGIDLLETAAERQARSPPPSLIPRLHCITARPLFHSHPLIPDSVTIPVERAGEVVL